jgi:hypothetical protein
MALGLAQPLTENEYQESPWGVKHGAVHKAENLTTIGKPIF